MILKINDDCVQHVFAKLNILSNRNVSEAVTQSIKFFVRFHFFFYIYIQAIQFRLQSFILTVYHHLALTIAYIFFKLTEKSILAHKRVFCVLSCFVTCSAESFLLRGRKFLSNSCQSFQGRQTLVTVGWISFFFSGLRFFRAFM